MGSYPVMSDTDDHRLVVPFCFKKPHPDGLTISKEDSISLRKGEKHPNRSGEYWSKDERQALIHDFIDGEGISDMAVKYQRTELAVVQELKNADMFENQSRRRRKNRTHDTDTRCYYPVCAVKDCPNCGKEFCDAGTV